MNVQLEMTGNAQVRDVVWTKADGSEVRFPVAYIGTTKAAIEEFVGAVNDVPEAVSND